MFKKIISLILILTFISVSSISIAVYESIPVWTNAIETMSKINNKVELKLSCESAILIDENTGTILYEKNSHEKLRPASVTKIMSLLLIMEALDNGKITLNDAVPCSERARKMGGSQIWLNETEKLSVNDMLKAICVVSANDCTVAMAEYLAGTEEAFVAQMNKKAKDLGMNDTIFKNSHGIDEDGHLTSAYDISLMSRELSKKHPQIHEYTKIWMDTLRNGESQLINTNKLIRFYSGATGLKTGSTSLALFNLSATATRNNLNLIAVVMKSPTSQERFDDAKILLDYGFANFTSYQLSKANEIIDIIEIPKSKAKEIELIYKEDTYALLSKGEEKNIEKEIMLFDNISAPLEYKEKVGNIIYKINGNELASADIVVNQKVEEKKIGDFLYNLLDFWYTVGRN